MYAMPQRPMARRSGRWRGLRDKTVHATAADSSFHSLSIQVVVKSSRLGHALSWRRDVLANERALSVGYLCSALNIDLGNKARLVTRVEDLE